MLISIENESGKNVVIDYTAIVQIENTWSRQYTITLSNGKDVQIDEVQFKKLVEALKTVSENRPAILVVE
jgi:hypothetical protein